jgi:hypothetical protein
MARSVSFAARKMLRLAKTKTSKTSEYGLNYYGDYCYGWCGAPSDTF